jgi:DNA-binding MarR family transcriptional regulator
LDIRSIYIGEHFRYLCVVTHNMGIEDQIQQKGFANLTEKTLVNISFTNSYLSGLMNTTLKSHAISLQQFNVLRILKGQHPKPTSINEITTRMVDKMSNASRLVDKLCTKGYAVRSTCEYDKRQVDININDKGQELLIRLNGLITEVIAQHNLLTSEEFKTLNSLLDKLRSEY